METVFPFSQSKTKFLSHDFHRGVVGQLEIVDTRHDRGKEVVRILWRLDRLSDYCQWRVERLETWVEGWGLIGVRERVSESGNGSWNARAVVQSTIY